MSRDALRFVIHREDISFSWQLSLTFHNERQDILLLYFGKIAMSAPKGPITKFPAEGLRHARRFITTHNKEGKGVFAVDDDGDHHRIMVDGLAVANIIYSTSGNPVDMNDDNDLVYARDNEVRRFAGQINLFV